MAAWLTTTAVRGIAPPTPTGLDVDRTIVEDHTLVVPFTIGDAESSPENLIVSAASSNDALVPDAQLVLGGAGATRELTINPLRVVDSGRRGHQHVQQTTRLAERPMDLVALLALRDWDTASRLLEADPSLIQPEGGAR